MRSPVLVITVHLAALLPAPGLGCRPRARPDAPPAGVCLRHATEPARTVIERPCGSPLAVLTDGARTALIVGPERRFVESTAPHPVVTRDWVRPLRLPFDGRVDDATLRWIDAARADPGPDALAVAAEYVDGAATRVDNGLRIAGDASYGPVADGERGGRKAGADFNDYLGITWRYPDGTTDAPEPDQIGALDCSGYVRMVWGYRLGLPLSHGSARLVDGAIPRRAAAIARAPIGVVIIPDSGAPTRALDRLQAGDLVFFDARGDDGPEIDHVGMVLGRDTAGHLRFISSRKGADGPTFGDVRGASTLDGNGLYARSLRSARRL